ncbi:hypothetical protein ES703_39863 [subsurface metagenome]
MSETNVTEGDNKGIFEIKMPFIDGKKLSDYLDKFPLKKQRQICKQIGKSIAKLHDSDIIHGDLTTSNMILVKDSELINTTFNKKINNFKKQSSKLKKLNLPVDEYAVFGSGPLAIHGIRNSEDIDIIVKTKLWDKLVKKYPQENKKLIKIGNLEVYKNWRPWFNDINKLIDNADIFNGIRFVKLKYVLVWKKAYNREKDKKDVQLIEQHQSMSKANVFFIDFGLGFISHKFEDKAVDLHLLRQALEAKHFKNWEVLFEEVLRGYKKSFSRVGGSGNAQIVLERLKAVEKRGRYKH